LRLLCSTIVRLEQVARCSKLCLNLTHFHSLWCSLCSCLIHCSKGIEQFQLTLQAGQLIVNIIFRFIYGRLGFRRHFNMREFLRL
jgi:hypothetical protein